jgi:hypothetical protein
MKRLFFVIVLVLVATLSFAQPYKATYSSKFKMGKQQYANMILDLWKDWDDNMLDRHDYLSDTVTAYFPDGSMVKGKAAFTEASKKYRSGFTTVKSVVHAWIPLQSEERNEDVVCIWGEEADTTPDGKTTKTSLHEVWFFNKAGKIASFRQWSAKPNEP